MQTVVCGDHTWFEQGQIQVNIYLITSVSIVLACNLIREADFGDLNISFIVRICMNPLLSPSCVKCCLL